MPGRMKQVCSIAGILLSTSFLLFAPIGCGKSSESTKVGQSASANGKAIDLQFAVPDGKPATILAFIKNLRENRPKFKSQEEAFAYSKNLQRAMVEAGDKILAQSADDTALREGATLKMIGTISVVMVQEPSSDQSEKLAKDALHIVNSFRNDKRPIVAEVANQFWVSVRAINFKTLTASERTILAEDALKNVAKLNLAHEAAGEAAYIADQFVAMGENDVAASMFEQLGKSLVKSNDKKIKSLAGNYYSKGRRLHLIGLPIELEGKLLTGNTLDWASYRGKVVLVDFWATWCGPCIADLPNVKALYEKYHSRGFEVIQVSLDRSRKELESFVKAKSLPWVQLFDTQIQDANNGQSPMAVKFNVFSIPTAFLVDQDGRVLSIDAHARELDPVLEKMLEPTADDSNSAEVDASAAPR